MFRLSTILLAGLLLLSACDQLSKAKEETLEAAENLKQEATELKENVEETVNEVKEAKESVVNAGTAVNEAVSDLKDIAD